MFSRMRNSLGIEDFNHKKTFRKNKMSDIIVKKMSNSLNVFLVYCYLMTFLAYHTIGMINSYIDIFVTMLAHGNEVIRDIVFF